jgi:hypothetical protein
MPSTYCNGRGKNIREDHGQVLLTLRASERLTKVKQGVLMSHQTVVVVDDDMALLTAVTDLMQFHLPDVRVERFCLPAPGTGSF